MTGETSCNAGTLTDTAECTLDPVDCVGSWSGCSETVSGNRLECKKTYTITTPRVGSGNQCPHTNGETQNCQSDPSNWSAQGTCRNYCPESVGSDQNYSDWVPRYNFDCDCWPGTHIGSNFWHNSTSGHIKRCGPDGGTVRSPYEGFENFDNYEEGNGQWKGCIFIIIMIMLVLIVFNCRKK